MLTTKQSHPFPHHWNLYYQNPSQSKRQFSFSTQYRKKTRVCNSQVKPIYIQALILSLYGVIACHKVINNMLLLPYSFLADMLPMLHELHAKMEWNDDEIAFYLPIDGEGRQSTWNGAQEPWRWGLLEKPCPHGGDSNNISPNAAKGRWELVSRSRNAVGMGIISGVRICLCKCWTELQYPIRATFENSCPLWETTARHTRADQSEVEVFNCDALHRRLFRDSDRRSIVNSAKYKVISPPMSA